MIYARELDRHYIPSRYPNAHPSGTPHEAYDEETSKRALSAAREVIRYVREVLGA
ncbi:MAG: HEPN domain-containing protein [Thermofilaceae archaeon]